MHPTTQQVIQELNNFASQYEKLTDNSKTTGYKKQEKL